MLGDYLTFWNDVPNWVVVLVAIIDVLLVAAAIVWVLMSKADATSAVAWCLVIFFLHFIGVTLFLLFGYQHVRRRLNRKRRHRARYQTPPFPEEYAAQKRTDLTIRADVEDDLGTSIAALAQKLGASAVTEGNEVEFYHDGPSAFDAMFAAIRTARSHIHLQFFIVEVDELGRRLIRELADKAKEGVEVRLLYDAIGSYTLSSSFLRPLHEAGGRATAFLPLSILRRRFQINLRNHRKIVVVDGETGFIGGLNVGDEYLGKVKRFGPWRDSHLRIRGPAVDDLQRVFGEDWDFAADERIFDNDPKKYFKGAPSRGGRGGHALQIIDSGPDQDYRAIREVLVAAIMRARRRVWFSTPYFVPDFGILDALRLAAITGRDVRMLFQYKPDHIMPYYAGRYYIPDILTAGVRVYQYAVGTMHAKMMVVDDDFASVGSANIDNRSMFLNFEANCFLYSDAAVRELETQFESDFAKSIPLDIGEFARRPFLSRLAENACRLFSPVL